MSISIRRSSQLIAAAAAAALLVSACSSSGGSSAPTTSAGGSSTPATTGTGATASTPAGSTILIGGQGSIANPAYNEPQLRDGMNAAVASINAAGGVSGHPLKLDFCDSGYDVNKELSCARKQVSEKVAAVVHASVLADGSGAEYKLWQTNNIAALGGLGLSPEENSNPDSYPLSSGVPGWFSGAAKALKEAGSKKIAIYADSNPGSQYSAGLIKDALTRLGLENAGIFTADPKADPTFATSAAKATGSGVDGIVLTPGPVNLPGMIKAISQTGYKGKLGTINTLLGFQAIKALGSLAEGIYVSSQFAFTTDTANTGVAKYLADMKQYEPKAEVDDTSLSGWSAVMLFSKVAATVSGDVTNTTFKTALDNLSTPIDIGTIGPWSVKGKSPALAAFPRIVNPYIAFGVVKGGVFVTDGKGFSNPFTS